MSLVVCPSIVAAARNAMPEFKYTRRCTHFHVSGRRCGIRISKDKEHCGLHVGDNCQECRDMMAAYQPPKGWRI